MCYLFSILLLLLRVMYEILFQSFLVLFWVIHRLTFVHSFEQPTRMNVELKMALNPLLRELIQSIDVAIILLTNNFYFWVVYMGDCNKQVCVLFTRYRFVFIPHRVVDPLLWVRRADYRFPLNVEYFVIIAVIILLLPSLSARSFHIRIGSHDLK